MYNQHQIQWIVGLFEKYNFWLVNKYVIGTNSNWNKVSFWWQLDEKSFLTANTYSSGSVLKIHDLFWYPTVKLQRKVPRKSKYNTLRVVRKYKVNFHFFVDAKFSLQKKKFNFINYEDFFKKDWVFQLGTLINWIFHRQTLVLKWH